MFRKLQGRSGRLWRLTRTSTVFQVLLILLLWQSGQWIADALHLPVPGSVIALTALLVLLGTGWMTPQTLQQGSRWFIAEMVLFLLPSVMCAFGHPELFGSLGLKVLAAILSGTVVVMVVTALVVEACYRWTVTHKAQP